MDRNDTDKKRRKTSRVPVYLIVIIALITMVWCGVVFWSILRLSLHVIKGFAISLP